MRGRSRESRLGVYLLSNSRKTDSLPAAKPAEFLFRLAPPEAVFALLKLQLSP